MPAGARKSFSLAIAASCAFLMTALMLATLAPGVAFAETHRGFTGHLGEKGSAAGQLEEPQGVAVNDTTGDVYVVDKGNNRIDEFEANGTFVRAWGWGVADGITQKLQTCTIACFKGFAGSGEGELEAPVAVAVDNSGSASDPSKEDVYVTNSAADVIEKFSASGEFKEELEEVEGASKGIAGVAVDPSGNVWLYAKNGQVVEFDDKGEYVAGSSFSTEKPEGAGLAVDSSSHLYIITSSLNVRRITVPAVSQGEREGVVVDNSGVASGVAASSASEVYVDRGAVVAEYGPFGEPFTKPVEEFGSRQLSGSSGIAVGSATGPVYASDTAGDVVDVFTLGETPKEAPKTTKPPSEITSTGAKLEGELNPGGATGKLEYQFNYNAGGSCVGGQSVPVSPGEVVEAKEAAVQATVTGLQPSEQYTYCLVAVNQFGSVQGNEVSFETLPGPPMIVSESAAPAAGFTEAALAAQIKPNNQETTYAFEYATNEALTGATTVPEVEAPLAGFSSEGLPVSVSTGAVLTPETLYYYRVTAENTKGEKAKPGKVEHFVTGAPATPEAVKPELVTATTAVLKGVLNPGALGNPGTYQFVYRQSATECQGGEPGEEKATAPEPATGAAAEPAQATVTELLPGAKYTFCLLARNTTGETAISAPLTFTTLPVLPTIESESTVDVTAESASLQAQVNPGGAETTYHFEYDTREYKQGEGPHGQSTPESASIGEGDSGLPALVNLQGLQPGTTYHYRVVATNTKGSEEGKDRVFTTQGSATAVSLPDGRQWEMVTPPNKQGAGIIPPGNEQGDDIQAAQAGDGITFGATAPFVANPAGNRSLEVTQVLSTRNAPGSWETMDISTPHYEGAVKVRAGDGGSAEYKLFSSDLSLGVVEPAGHTPLPPLPPGSEKTIYLRNAGGEYQALVTSANVPLGTKFGSEGETGAGFDFISATPDLSHVALQATEGERLTSTPPPGKQNEGSMLYEWSGGQLQLASVLHNGEPINGSLGAGFGGPGSNYRHAISTDGSRIIWEAQPQGESQSLFMRDMVREETVKLAGGVKFQTADNEDSRVFFSSEQAGPNKTSLSVFEVTSGRGEPLAGRTQQLTKGGGLLGVVIGASEDGSYIYFADTGVLGDGAEHGAENGGDNLYVEHYDEGTKTWAPPTFITSGAASYSWGGPEPARLDYMTARVSPDGRYLAFMSSASLTGYDNRDANSGVPDEEVYLYDASTGRLVCASCDPTGARPVGLLVGVGGFERLTAYNNGVLENTWLAGNIPTWTPENGIAALYQPRYLSNEGRLFFNSSDALVPADVNGEADVYEYEPTGLGSCQPPGYGQSASVVFVEKIGGCVGLISAGTSSGESAFMDASETGGDVFFLTSSRLSPLDTDTSLDIYDAHECTPSAPCAPAPPLAPPPCSTGDACKPAPTPQPTSFGAPSSETFSGAGNLPPPPPSKKVTKKTVKCKRHFVKNRKGKCVRVKAKTKSKKSSHGKGRA